MAETVENKTSFLRKLGNDAGIEMSFVDHLEALRWHLVRAVLVWLVAVIAIFTQIDWVFDNIVYAPARSTFVSYRALCDFSHWLHLGQALCMPAVSIT